MKIALQSRITILRTNHKCSQSIDDYRENLENIGGLFIF